MIKQEIAHIIIYKPVRIYCYSLPFILVKTDKLSFYLKPISPLSYSPNLFLFNSSFACIINFPSLIYNCHHLTIILKLLYFELMKSPRAHPFLQLKPSRIKTALDQNSKGVIYPYSQFLAFKFLLCLILKFYFTEIGLNKVINNLFLAISDCQFSVLFLFKLYHHLILVDNFLLF